MKCLYSVVEPPLMETLLTILRNCGFAKKGYFYIVSEDKKKNTDFKLSQLETCLVKREETKGRISYQTSKLGTAMIYRVNSHSVDWLESKETRLYPNFELFAQDLTIIRESGEIWFHSVTHEHLYWLCLTDKEINSIAYQFNGVLPFQLKADDNLLLAEKFSISLL